jgi:hypothetical protein
MRLPDLLAERLIVGQLARLSLGGCATSENSQGQHAGNRARHGILLDIKVKRILGSRKANAKDSGLQRDRLQTRI